MNAIGYRAPSIGSPRQGGTVARTVRLAIGLVILNGCHYCRPSCTDWYLQQAGYPFDTTAASASPIPTPADRADQTGDRRRPPAGGADDQRPGDSNLPADLPGADAPPILLPDRESPTGIESWRKAIQDLYPPIGLPPGIAQSTGEPLSLLALQAMAMEYNPRIQEAASAAEAARGAMIQAGLYPNPTAGYQSDTVNTANTRGYHGVVVSQTFVTMGKLKLSREAACFDLENAELALKRTRIEVASQVRSRYFAVLVLAERRKLARALTDLSDRVFRTQVEIVKGGEAAPYEPMQLRVMALQTRATLVQADQQYVGAWRQLAAALGLPDLPPGTLLGRADDPIPKLDYAHLSSLMLATHSDIQIARNQVSRADVLLRLARVTPVPDISVNSAIQRDYTFVPGTTTYNLQLVGDLPVFNRNQGNIVSAQANLFQADKSVERVGNELLSELADAFARYEANRLILQAYQADALRDQVRVYRGVYERYRKDPVNLQFNDVVVAQQTLGTLLTQYIDTLGNQWQAMVDIGRIVQADDLFALGERMEDVPFIPDVQAGDPAE